MLRRSDQGFPEAARPVSSRLDVGEEYAAFGRALGKILGKLGMPFTSLRGNGAMRSSPFFCSTAHIETLVRLHVVNLPNHSLGARKLRAKGKVMVNIHRGWFVPTWDIGLALR